VRAQNILAAAILLPLLGCSEARFYTGDGTFTDNGWMVYSRRFVIDLGAVDLSVPGTYTYKLSGLPHAEMNVGLRVFEAKKNEWDVIPNYPATVRMELRTAQGEIVISEERPLNAWVRSFSALETFSDLYLRGESREIPLGGRTTRSEQVGVKASGGWGTYFNSEREMVYALTLVVLSTSPSMKRPARLQVVGWDRA
jgi:hypothetical protein